jgi:hypothetical protein
MPFHNRYRELSNFQVAHDPPGGDGKRYAVREDLLSGQADLTTGCFP